ncbi:Transposase, Ptta/En/Spm, plant [Corchorus olitorius]|uniref:Transposase, Ptta/En/Spm, plant n=1 Tax=Corchorus olitorius TaxID=93759 RepID=A0A1R3K2C7_9ROSI|nr:Transposase, Ptta/En/Spm, plant [Corchorus olitorius]
MAKSKQGDGSKTCPKKDKEKGKRKVNPQPPPPSAPKKKLRMPPAMNGAVTTRGTASATNGVVTTRDIATNSGSTSQEQPEPPSQSTFRLQPPPRQTNPFPLANVHPPPEDNDEEEVQEEDEMDEEGVDRDGLDHDLEAEEDAPDVQHDQQQQPVKLPPYPSLPLSLAIICYMGMALQEKNKKNRNANGFASTSGCRGGRVSTYTHRQRLVIEKRRKPTMVEIYERMHGRKDGTYPPGRTTITMQKFQAVLERAKTATHGDQEALRATDEDVIFDEVAG